MRAFVPSSPAKERPMADTSDDLGLIEELENFQRIARSLKPGPGEIPRLEGIDVHGISRPLKSIVGGDHIVYMDFNARYDLDARIRRAEADGKKRVAEQLRLNKSRIGFLVADVAGHRITDALVAAMLHQAFLLGALYELESFGEITTRLFENIRTRFFRSSTLNKYVTMIYGEINAEGRFRFISAAHPPPLVFSSRYGKFVDIGPERRATSTPIGLFTSSDDVDETRLPNHVGYTDRYRVNEIDLLGRGDILLLHTDGLSEHAGGTFFPERLERIIDGAKDRGAQEICDAIWQEVLAAGEPEDDITFVAVKRG
jgi:serine phosphatase RsbU (regulator of sigma subunit)